MTRTVRLHRRRGPALLLALATLAAPHAGGACTPDAAALAAVADAGAPAWPASLLAAGYPGARMLVVRGDARLVDASLGHADLARRRPMPADAIFRLYSMTKPVVSAAVLRYIAEGRAGLDDPVAAHLPALAGLQRMHADGRLSPPARAPSLRHLLTHTAGFPLAEGAALRRREQARLEDSASLADYVARLGEVPLEREPGTAFGYDSIATEVLGRLLEVWSGQPLDVHLRESLFADLGMRDTGFEVEAAQRHRIVAPGRCEGGRLVALDAPHARVPGTPLRPYPSAAGGLYSTAEDYLAFARMLLQAVRGEGPSWLPQALAAEMFADQLGPMGLAAPHVDATPGRGFGLGVSVLLDPAALGRAGAACQAGWSGAASTWFVIDPATQGIGLLLMQHLPRDDEADLPRPATAFYNHVQQVISK